MHQVSRPGNIPTTEVDWIDHSEVATLINAQNLTAIKKEKGSVGAIGE